MDEKEDYSFTEERLRNVRLTKKDDIEKLHTWIEEQLLAQKNDGQLTDVTIAYHLENGKVVYRNYPIANVSQIEAFDPIYTTKDYKTVNSWLYVSISFFVSSGEMFNVIFST